MVPAAAAAARGAPVAGVPAAATNPDDGELSAANPAAARRRVVDMHGGAVTHVEREKRTKEALVSPN